MKTMNVSRVGLPRALVALPVAIVLGCSGGAPDSVSRTDPGEMDPTESTSQALLAGGRLFCAGPDDWACAEDAVCLPVAGGCPGPEVYGLCVPAPRRCFPISNPVCGCDDNSYANVCEALRAGTALQHQGECEEPGPPACSGETPCPGSGLCVDETGEPCGRAGNDDCTGACICKVIEKCSPREVWNPDPAVCGCVPAPPDACGGVECPARTECVTLPDGSPSCEPIPEK